MKNLTVHHLIPRQHTKRKNLEISPTIDICSPCHRQIHALFDNKRLAKELNTIEALKAEPQMGKFLAWVKKQNPQKYSDWDFLGSAIADPGKYSIFNSLDFGQTAA